MNRLELPGHAAFINRKYTVTPRRLCITEQSLDKKAKEKLAHRLDLSAKRSPLWQVALCSPCISACVVLKQAANSSGFSRSGEQSPSWLKHWARAEPPRRWRPGLRGTHNNTPADRGQRVCYWRVCEGICVYYCKKRKSCAVGEITTYQIQKSFFCQVKTKHLKAMNKRHMSL